VPAAQITPFALLYIARSTAMGCVDSMTAPNASSASSGTMLLATLMIAMLKRRVGGTSNVFTTGGPPSARRNRTMTVAVSVPGFASRMNV
jgi:hypothetical protein